MYKKHGAYYFVTPDNQWIRLGATESEMYRELSKLSVQEGPLTRDRITMLHVIHEWLVDEQEGLPSKGEKTQMKWIRMVPRIEQFFGEAQPKLIRPHHIRSFMEYDRWEFQTQRKDESGNRVVEVRRLGRTSANRHVEVLSTILTYAVQRGYLDDNPCREVKRNRERPRTRLPNEHEFREARERANRHLALLMDAAYMTGMRKADLIGLQRSSLKEDGIEYTPSKTERTDARVRLISWTDDLRAVVDEALEIQKAKCVISSFVFTPPQADHWTNSGFNSAWTRLSPGFHFHDIRAMAATHHENVEDAKRMLAHNSESTTAIYRRGKVKVTSIPRISEPRADYAACALPIYQP